MTNHDSYVLDGGRFDPMASQRIAAGWVHILRLLKDGEWHQWSDIVTEVKGKTDLAPKTISNLLHKGVTSGYYERQGNHRVGTRQVRQIHWP